MKSENIDQLAMALAKMQGQTNAAKKDGKNPHLGNSYATLDSIIESVRKPLSSNGLAFSQVLNQGCDGLMLETWLMHESGQFIQSELLVTPSAGNRGINELQSLGSALTYMKRYALAAILGVSVEDDDDGNAAIKKSIVKKQVTAESGTIEKSSNDKNGNVKKGDFNAFWLYVRTNAVDEQVARQVLAETGNDFDVALDRLSHPA